MRISPFSLLTALPLMFALASPAAAEKILTITSDPPGATVSINGQVAGVTPIQEKVKEFWFNGPKYLWSEFLNQPIHLTVGKEGYEPQTITITSGPYRWVNLNNTSEKIYYVIKQDSFHVVLRKVDPLHGQVPVAVSSEPAGAEIRVDGSLEGSTPSKILLQPGEHTITVTRPGFKPWQRAINVEPNSEKTLNALLEAEGPNARPVGQTYSSAAAMPSQNGSRKPELVVATGHSESVFALAFSPDDRLLASGDIEGVIKLWDARTGIAVATLTDKGFMPQADPAVYSLAFSPDGALLAVGNMDKTISIYNTATGRVARTLTGLTGEVDWLIFVNGQTLESYNTDDVGDNPEIKLWNASSGELIKTVTDKTTDHGAVIFMGGNMGGGLAVSDRFYAYSLPGGGVDLFSRSSAQTMDFSPQSKVARLYLFSDNDWIIATPGGLFEGSPGGWSNARWRFNGDAFDTSGLELYFNEFFYPNLLHKVFAGETPQPPDGLRLEEVDRRQPSVLISDVNGEANPGFEGRRAAGFRTDKRIASITITVADNVGEPRQAGKAATSGAQDLRLFRNGSLIHIWRGDLFGLGEKDGCTQFTPPDKGEPRRVRCRADVSIVAGENDFTAYAFNGEKVKSEDSEFLVNGSDALKRERTLYVLAIGVGQYENPEFNLSYTVKDAQDFGAEVRRRQEAVGFYKNIEVIQLLDDGARKDFILSALKTLAEAVQPEDGLIVFFSGHGTAQGDRYYLLPSDIGYKGPRSKVDAAALQTMLAHGISDEELESAFASIDAGVTLLVIDACNSGKALQAEDWRRGPMDTKGLGQLAYEKGMYMLTASQDAELAYESAALKHSYLTYALIEEGLKTRINDADADADGRLFLREWLSYAKRRVPHIRGELAGTAVRPRADKSLDEEGGVEQGAAAVQRPGVIYGREPKLLPFVVAKPGPRTILRNAKEGAR